MSFDVFEYTNRGGRDYNEDSVAYQTDGRNGIFVLADGLGGHQFGEVASNCLCATLIDSWNTKGIDIEPKEWLNREILSANDRILEIQKEKNAVLKSTAVALLINGGKATWANVGDSRLYYIHNNEINCCTNDHSVAFKKYKAGEITKDEIRNDEDQSALLRSLGSEDRFEPEFYEADNFLQSGDAFLLCSDGVWEYFSDEELVIDLLKAESARDWAELVLLRLMGRIDGTNDNLSIITVIIP